MVLLKLESLAQNILVMLNAVKKSNGALKPGKVGCAPGRLPDGSTGAVGRQSGSVSWGALTDLGRESVAGLGSGSEIFTLIRCSCGLGPFFSQPSTTVHRAMPLQFRQPSCLLPCVPVFRDCAMNGRPSSCGNWAAAVTVSRITCGARYRGASAPWPLGEPSRPQTPHPERSSTGCTRPETRLSATAWVKAM